MKERNPEKHEMNIVKGLAAILGATALMMIALACGNGSEPTPTLDGASTPVATSTAAPPPASPTAPAVPSPTPAASPTTVPSPTPAASSTAPAPSGVHLTLSAEQAPDQPLTVDLVAEIVGGPDNNRDLYCKCLQWEFGDWVGTALCFACAAPAPDWTLWRRFETSHTYEVAGTYEIKFYYGPLKSEPFSACVKSVE